MDRTKRLLTITLVFGVVLGVSCLLGLPAFAQDIDEWKESGSHDEFPIGELRPQTGWVDTAVPADQWSAAEQPDLQALLDAAPELALRNVAPPPERCWVSNQPYLVPNPQGNWNMIFPYFNGYGGRQEVIIYNFDTGEMARQYFNTGEEDAFAHMHRVDFHMQPAFYTHDKFIFEIAGALAFLIYDIREEAFVHGARPFGNEITQGRSLLGEDGNVYGMGWERKNGRFVAYKFNPETYETTRFEAFGPENHRRRELYRAVTMSGDWIYAGIGANPWHLVAFNVETEEGKHLATSDVIGSHATVALTRMIGGISGHIENPSEIIGIDLDDVELVEFRGEQRFNFWLHDGNIYPRENNVPPWSDEPVERDSRRVSWGRGPGSWSGVGLESEPPRIDGDSVSPVPGGNVTLRYRFPDDEDWNTLEYNVDMYPGVVQRVSEINATILFALDSGYGEHVFYNIENDTLRRVEGSLSPYSLGMSEDKLYVSGYPNSMIVEYDFSKPLGRRQQEPNPKMVGRVGTANQTHYPLDNTQVLADGRVYNAGTTVGRRRIGGGYGWYDPATSAIGGEPVDGHRFFWNASAADDRYFMMSSKYDAETGMIFCWDSEAEEIIYQLEIPNAPHPGPIVEAMPGLIIGHAPALEGDGGFLYGLRVETGEVLWAKDVPVGPVTSFSECRRHSYSYRRGPDGFIWAFFGDTLVRIDPRNAYVKPVGKPGVRAQIAFAGGNVYIASGNRLRMIEGIETPVW